MKHGKHRNEIFPTRCLPCGEGGQRKTFYVLECKKPNCHHSLKLTPSAHNRLAIPVIVKLAMQKGWYADRTGYVLCPDHKPGTRLKNTPPMKPQARRAAFLRIRDEHMASGAAIAPATMLPQVELPTVNEIHTAILDKAVLDGRLNKNDQRVLGAVLAGLKLPKQLQQKEIAQRLQIDHSCVSRSIKKLVDLGYIGKVPHSRRLFAIVQKPPEPAVADPAPIIEMEQEELLMPDIAAQSPVSAPSSASATPPPRQPTRDDNRRIRDHLDSVYDEKAGRYIKDWSDEKSAKQLNVPRAWIMTLRSSLYGEDRNEAQEQRSAQLEELAARAEKLEEDALGIATRAEALAKDARKLLG